MAKNNNLGDFLKGIANSIRTYLLTEDLINPQDFENKITEVYNIGEARGTTEGYNTGKTEGIAEGKQAEYDKFWDNFQQNGNRNRYEYAFAWEGWTNEIFKPKYDITVELRNSANMFAYSGITGSLKTILNNNGVSLAFRNTLGNFGAQYIFVGTKFTELPELDFSEAKGNAALASAFSGSKLIQRIEKIILPNNCTGYGTNTFYECYALENITFEGIIKYSLSFQYCPLSADSVYSILNHLDTNEYTGTRTITLKQVAKDNYIEKYGETEWNNNIASYSNYGWTFAINN